MKILITGGAGYIGSQCVYQLLDHGDDVVVIDNLSTGVRKNLPKDINFYYCDLADNAKVKQIIKDEKCDAIIHFAGSLVVNDSVANPSLYYQNNVINSKNLLDITDAQNIEYFIFSSTAAVYGELEDGFAIETLPCRPINPYGRSKLMIEQMIQDYHHAYGLKYGILRYFNVAGADMYGRTGQSTPSATNLIKVACETAFGKHDYLKIYGTDYPTHDGTAIRDYIHVSDLVNAHINILNHIKYNDSDIFNCGTAKGFSVLDVVDMVQKIHGGNIKVIKDCRRDFDPAKVIADNKKISDLTDWYPQYSDLETIISTAYQWEKKINVCV